MFSIQPVTGFLEHYGLSRQAFADMIIAAVQPLVRAKGREYYVYLDEDQEGEAEAGEPTRNDGQHGEGAGE
jgi:hypothetical protein